MELIRKYDKANCPNAAMLKVDIQKAFDYVCWDFVDKLCVAQNFPPLFRQLIMQSIFLVRFLVVINGGVGWFFLRK